MLNTHKIQPLVRHLRKSITWTPLTRLQLRHQLRMLEKRMCSQFSSYQQLINDHGHKLVELHMTGHWIVKLYGLNFNRRTRIVISARCIETGMATENEAMLRYVPVCSSMFQYVPVSVGASPRYFFNWINMRNVLESHQRIAISSPSSRI